MYCLLKSKLWGCPGKVGLLLDWWPFCAKLREAILCSDQCLSVCSKREREKKKSSRPVFPRVRSAFGNVRRCKRQNARGLCFPPPHSSLCPVLPSFTYLTAGSVFLLVTFSAPASLSPSSLPTITLLANARGGSLKTSTFQAGIGRRLGPFDLWAARHLTTTMGHVIRLFYFFALH